MRPANLLPAAILALSALQLVACTGTAEDDTQSDEGELRKRVNPTGGNAVVSYEKSRWSIDDAVGSLRLAVNGGKEGNPLGIGKSVDRAPGRYGLNLDRQSIEDGQIEGDQIPLELVAGKTTVIKTTGLRVRFDKPVTLGGVKFESSLATLQPLRPWRGRANGVTIFMLPGAIDGASSSASSAPLAKVDVAEGARGEIVLPTARAEVQVDTIDPEFPSSPTCAPTSLEAGGEGTRELLAVRKEDGTGIAPQVIPQGDRANVAIVAYGARFERPTVAGQTVKFTLNRLEVDDIAISGGQGTSKVRGQYRVQLKLSDGTFQDLRCGGGAVFTHTGMDVPDGTYRITSFTTNVAVPITHVDEVTFP